MASFHHNFAALRPHCLPRKDPGFQPLFKSVRRCNRLLYEPQPAAPTAAASVRLTSSSKYLVTTMPPRTASARGSTSTRGRGSVATRGGSVAIAGE